MKTALITGVTGQDGSYLAEFLLEKGYRVVGLMRRSSSKNIERICNILTNPNFILEEFDLTDPSGIYSIVDKYRPDELYNLGAQSHVGTSFCQPTTTFEVDTVGVVNLLEAIRKISPSTKFYQASTSEMFGYNFNVNAYGEKYQNEKTALLPQSPYGVAKLASHNLVRIYRSSYNIYACSGILFNHESPRRGENFVTRKITKWLGEFTKWKNQEFYTLGKLIYNPNTIYYGRPTNYGPEEFPKLHLGNIEAFRDWGHAKDYVRAMWLMLQQNEPDDFVICTGETHSVKEFLEKAFSMKNLNYKDYVVIDPELFRPAEVEYLRGDCSKAKSVMGWNPQISFNNLVKEMVEADEKMVR